MTKARDLANGGFGLVLIKPSSVVNGTDNGNGVITLSGVTSVSLNNVFSSNYDNYKIMFASASASGSLSLTLRAGGSNNSTSNYHNAVYSYRSGNAASASTANENAGGAALIANMSNIGYFEINVFNPALNSETDGSIVGNYGSGSAGYRVEAAWGAFRHSVAYQADGFHLGFGGTTSGTVAVYGYKK